MRVALVDDEDFEELNQYNWCANKIGKTWYAVRAGYIDEKKVTISMHQQITGFQYKLIDHINRDGLDNRRCNLRKCNHSQNKINTLMWKHNTSGVKGVSWDKKKKKWGAHIQKNSRHFFLGYFDNKEEAGRAYKIKAKELFGEFATSD